MDSGTKNADMQCNRRQFLAVAGTLVPAGVVSGASAVQSGEASTAPATSSQRHKISASDWMLLKRQMVSALPLAKDCGCDGVESDVRSLGSGEDMNNELRDADARRRYLEASKTLGIELSWLAMSAFYAQSYADHPKAESFTDEWLELITQLGIKVGFLPLGGAAGSTASPRRGGRSFNT